jgi:hypothetical protein
MYIGLHVMYLVILSDFNELKFSGQNFQKTIQISKFHENSSSGSQVVPREQVDGRTDGQTDRHDVANSHFLQFYKLD